MTVSATKPNAATAATLASADSAKALANATGAAARDIDNGTQASLPAKKRR